MSADDDDFCVLIVKDNNQNKYYIAFNCETYNIDSTTKHTFHIKIYFLSKYYEIKYEIEGKRSYCINLKFNNSITKKYSDIYFECVGFARLNGKRFNKIVFANYYMNKTLCNFYNSTPSNKFYDFSHDLFNDNYHKYFLETYITFSKVKSNYIFKL